MALTPLTTTTFTNEYQKLLSKQLLQYAVQNLVLEQFAQKAPLPRNAGVKSIRFFRFGAPATTGIQDLTSGGEGTVIPTSRALTQTVVDIDLNQYGQVVQLTDVLTMTDFVSSLQQATKTNGEDAALHCDTIIRNKLIAASSPTKRYSGTTSGVMNTFAQLIALNTPGTNNVMVATDVLDACTQLKINRAPTIGGRYVGIIPPQVSRDIMATGDWLLTKQYSDAESIYKGEIGSFHGVRMVEATNPWTEDETEGTVATSFSAAGTNTSGFVYTTVFTGGQAYGAPELSGNSPLSPQVIITDKADKADPLNQTINVGFKTFWNAKDLNVNYYILHRSKSTKF